MGVQARLMSQALRKLTATCSKSRTLVIFINQLRMKIGVMFGNPETTTGGNALKFYASVRLDVRRIGAIKDPGGKDNEASVIGNRTRVKVAKNKVASPFRETEFDVLYGQGISLTGEVIDLGSTPSSSRRVGAGSPTTASASARGGRAPGSSSPTTRRRCRPSGSSSSRRLGSAP